MKASVWQRFIGACALLVLAACGGGGGGEEASSAKATVDQTQLTVTANSGELGPVRTVLVTVSDMPDSGVYVGVTHTYNGLVTASLLPSQGNTGWVSMTFQVPAILANGTYNDTVTIDVCLDVACNRKVGGSPLTVQTSYIVKGSSIGVPGNGTDTNTPPPQTGLPPLAPASRTALPHDVVDAEFSRALNAVVMVASYPQPALLVMDAATGTVRQQALNKMPKAVSVSPDGLWAAVGHDALVTHVNLNDLSAPPRHLNVSANVGDLVLDGNGKVHVFPATDQWVSIHSIDIASNTEVLQYGPYAGAMARLHPNGRSIYSANRGLSPDDIEHYDISSGAATRLRDSPYHGDYPMCGNLWFNEEGFTVYTACGNTFRTSQDAAQDMRYTGAMTLSTSGQYSYGYRIQSLSHSAARGEVVVVEQPWFECTVGGSTGGCVSHLAVYDSAFLGRTAVFSIAPVTVAGRNYDQRGLFVFHRQDGARVLISRLDAMPNPAAEFLLSILP